MPLGLMLTGLAGAVTSAALSAPLGAGPGMILLTYALGGAVAMMAGLLLVAQDPVPR
jgi:hypothetical protein